MANYNSIKNAALIAPTTNPDLGSANNRYGNVYLSGNVNIAGTSLTSTNALIPRVSAIVYGTGATADDTATAPAGGLTLTLTGSGFNYGAAVYIGGIPVSVVTVVDSTQITFTSPAKTAGNYPLVVLNPDGATATLITGIQYSGTPAWTTTAGSLGAYTQGTAFSATLAATSDSTVTYSITSGALPSGITLNSTTGFLSGTMPTVSGSTTYNFTVRATDGENQDTDRNFSVNVATAPPTGQVAYTTPGTYSWTVPGGVTSISAVVVGGGTGGSGSATGQYAGGGSGGALRYINSVSVTPGETLTILSGAGGTGGSSYGGSGGTTSIARGSNILLKSSPGYSSTVGAGTYGGTVGGFDGGSPGTGGGGAGGYAGSGGNGGSPFGVAGTGGAGGGGGGFNQAGGRAGSGGGVGIFGQGDSGGAGGTDGNYNGYGGGGGSGGSAGNQTGPGGSYGGGGGGCGSSVPGGGVGGGGAVRIIWGPGRSFPSTLTTDQ